MYTPHGHCCACDAGAATPYQRTARLTHTQPQHKASLFTLTKHETSTTMVPPAHAQRFQPVIFSDAGSNLYPLCDMPQDTLPKALVSVLNCPMIAYPLQWIVSAGFRTCLLVAPESEHSALAAALRSLYLVPAGVSHDASNARNVEISASDQSNVSVRTGNASSAGPVGVDALVEPSVSAPVLHVDLVPAGPAPDEPVRSLLQPTATVSRARWGTAQLLYWLAVKRQLTADPLVVPVDLIAPHMPLASFLATHLAATPEPPTVSCLFYERGAGEGTGKERERDGPANLFTAYSRAPLRVHEGLLPSSGVRDNIGVYRPLLVMDSDDVSDKNPSDLELRMSMLWQQPHVRISTALLDSHVYALRLKPLLPLLEQHPELNNITEQLVPFVIKCGWQTRLSTKAGWTEAAPGGSSALAAPAADVSPGDMGTPWASVADVDAEPVLYVPRSEMVVVRLGPEIPRPLPPSHVLDDKPHETNSLFMARANTVPTYLECSRYLLRFAASGAQDALFALPADAGCGAVPFEMPRDEGDEGPIHPRAQLSADCLVGAGTQIEERATIKHSIIGRNCTIGKGARIMRSIIMDHVSIGDSAKLENCIVGIDAEIGDRAQLRESDVGPQHVVPRGTESKNEKLVAYTEEE